MKNSLVQAADALLQQGEIMLEQLSDSNYTQKMPTVFNASIGGHFRHCLDHFQLLHDSCRNGVVNYDDRQRGTSVEFNRMAAFVQTQALRQALQEMEQLDQPLLILAKSTYAGDTAEKAMSTLGRELIYAVSHAIHHFALIKVMANLQGASLPASFGIAPSTLQYRDCAEDHKKLALTA